MRFPNAYSGVKKIFTAEILSIIGTVAAVLSAFFVLLGVIIGTDASTESSGTAGLFLLLFLVFLLIAAVFTIISTVLQIVGLSLGRKDEELFNTALKFVFIYLIGVLAYNIVSSITGFADSVPGKIIGSVANGVATVAQVLVIFYIITAIGSLAEKCGNTKLQKKGETLIRIIIVILLISAVSTILGSFVLTGVAAGILALVGAVLTLVGYIIYLTYLAQAKRMLAKAE